MAKLRKASCRSRSAQPAAAAHNSLNSSEVMSSASCHEAGWLRIHEASARSRSAASGREA